MSRKFENAQYFKSYSFWLSLGVCAKCSKNKIGKSVSASLFCKCTVVLKP